MAYGVYSDRGYREHILERNKNTNKTEVFTQEDQTFTGRKTFLSGVTTSDLEVKTIEVSESLKVKGKDIAEIIDYLPNDVSQENKLTTEDFVNSSIATNTAYFRGTFDSVQDLEAYEGEKTNNDYAFVRTADEFGAISFNRYKYNSKSKNWEYEYTLNNSSFTSAQWEAINSGITAEKVALIPNSAVAQIDDDSKDAMHAWSGAKVAKEIEFVDNKNNYSTEETVIGKWIDGKPIYRNVLNINPVNIRDWTSIPEVDNLNIKKIIKAVVMGVEVENQDCVIFSNVRRNPNGKFEFLSYFWAITASIIILEYTKTTD